MKNFFNFFKSSFKGLIIVIIFTIVGSEVFQGQKTSNMFNYDESDPYIDRPTREAMQHVVEGDGNFDIITDESGFDNFQIGSDFAEQMLVSNPVNPINMQFGVNSSSGQNAHYTLNGHDWFTSNPSYHPSICCDPWSAWDSLGVLHYASGVSGQYVYNSTDGGQTYGPAVLSVNGADRNTIAADQTNGPYSNYLYAAITGAGSTGPFTRSTDGGLTWAQTYSASNGIPGVMIAVGPNGSIQGGTVMYVTNTGSTANVTYTFHKSNDGGASFVPVSTLNVAGYVGTLNTMGRLVINNGRTRPYPMIAMDNSYGPHRGRFYLVYASNEPVGNGNKPDVILQYSDDQGSTWSNRITVNDNINPELSDQWFPAIWCVKETGRLYMKWYDTRDNPAAYGVNVYATYTDDGGLTFAPNQKLTTQSWTYPSPACGANQNCYRGDYDGMTANPKSSFSVWYDGRSGTYQNIGAYFPDYAMKVNPPAISIDNGNTTIFRAVVPAVKLYTDTIVFTATVTPPPASGALTVTFPGGNKMTSFPDSLVASVHAAPLTSAGNYTITVTGKGPNGTPIHIRTVALTVGLVGVSSVNEIPVNYQLSQNFPNPFNPSTKINYSLKNKSEVTLSIFDVSGKLVQTIVKGVQSPGSYFVEFNGAALSSGAYYYKLETEFFTDTKKMLLVK
ncbi:MAG: T9SS type A sorting domain-containing protein [bacterium]